MPVACSLQAHFFSFRCSAPCTSSEEVEWATEQAGAAEKPGYQPNAAPPSCRRPSCSSESSADVAEQSTDLESGASLSETTSFAGDEPADWADGRSHASSPSAPPVDLSGRWVLSRVEGDFEALMIDVGVSWAMRKMAKSMNYGAGLVTHSIEQEGNSLVIEFKNGPGQATSAMRLAVGGGNQSTANEDGAPIVVEPRWEGRCLVVAGLAADGSAVRPSKRFVTGQEMVCESTTSSGDVVRRYFARC